MAAKPCENPNGLDPQGSTDRPSQSTPRPESELLKLQLTSFLEVYKHHFDLFLKGVAGYFIVVSTLTNFALAKDATRPKGIAFSLAICIGSLIAFSCCAISKRWVEDLERTLGRITTALSGEPLPFSGAKGILSVTMVISVVFCIGGLVELWIVWKQGKGG